MLLTNELPKLCDASGALVSRFIVLRLTESFFGREDHDLTSRLLAELPSILLWAITGWRQLRERGRFIQPETGKEMLDQLDELTSPVGMFVRERCNVRRNCVYQLQIYSLLGRYGARRWGATSLEPKLASGAI